MGKGQGLRWTERTAVVWVWSGVGEEESNMDGQDGQDRKETVGRTGSGFWVWSGLWGRGGSRKAATIAKEKAGRRENLERLGCAA